MTQQQQYQAVQKCIRHAGHLAGQGQAGQGGVNQGRAESSRADSRQDTWHVHDHSADVSGHFTTMHSCINGMRRLGSVPGLSELR